MDKVIEFPEHVCQICKKREATRLCDRIKGEYHIAGHPPIVDGRMENVPMHDTITCDVQMCDKCATNIAGMDFCPKCLKEIKEALGAK